MTPLEKKCLAWLTSERRRIEVAIASPPNNISVEFHDVNNYRIYVGLWGDDVVYTSPEMDSLMGYDCSEGRIEEAFKKAFKHIYKKKTT